MSNVHDQYKAAAGAYGALGVDTDAALEKLDTIPVSIHCRQGHCARLQSHLTTEIVQQRRVV